MALPLQHLPQAEDPAGTPLTRFKKTFDQLSKKTYDIWSAEQKTFARRRWRHWLAVQRSCPWHRHHLILFSDTWIWNLIVTRCSAANLNWLSFEIYVHTEIEVLHHLGLCDLVIDIFTHPSANMGPQGLFQICLYLIWFDRVMRRHDQTKNDRILDRTQIFVTDLHLVVLDEESEG